MKYDVIVVGAGIVGLAASLKLLEKNPNLKLLIIEKENDIALHQTGNNSGVIHSGIYYKPGSLKAQNCTNGYKMLLDFCDKNDVKYDICGKIIVAVSEKEIPYMDKIFQRGNENGLTGIRKISKAEMKEIEPHVDGVAGLIVPQTGIVDFTLVSKKYLELIKSYGGEIKLNEKVVNIIKSTSGTAIVTEKNLYNSKTVLTCGGLQSDRIAKTTNKNLPLRIIPFRGEYYKLKKEKRNFVNNLIYPVPDPAFPFLGVHFTRMIDGDVECGPNAVLSFKREGYTKTSFSFKDSFDTFTWPGFYPVMKKNLRTGIGEFYRSFNKNAFVKALQRLIPEVSKDDLEEGGAGVRAQACDNKGSLLDDFYIVESENIIHVCNAPSPAATASLSIGDFIADKTLHFFNN